MHGDTRWLGRTWLRLCMQNALNSLLKFISNHNPTTTATATTTPFAKNNNRENDTTGFHIGV